MMTVDEVQFVNANHPWIPCPQGVCEGCPAEGWTTQMTKSGGCIYTPDDPPPNEEFGETCHKMAWTRGDEGSPHIFCVPAGGTPPNADGGNGTVENCHLFGDMRWYASGAINHGCGPGWPTVPIHFAGPSAVRPEGTYIACAWNLPAVPQCNIVNIEGVEITIF
jgi:hypothetical protein